MKDLRLPAFLLSLLIGVYLFQILWGSLNYFSDIILILFLSWVLSFILDPIVDWLSSYKLPRALSAMVVYLLLASLISWVIFLILPIIISQMLDLSNKLPYLTEQTPKVIKNLDDYLKDKGLNVEISQSLQSSIGQLSSFGVNTADKMLAFISSFLNTIISVVLVLIISFYLVLDGEKLERRLVKFLPRRWGDEADFLLHTVNTSFSGFLKGQLTISIIWGVAVWVILLAFQINFSPLAGIMSGILMIVPFIGGFLGFIPPLLLVLLVDPNLFWLVFLVLIIAQTIEMNVFAPIIFEKSVGLHPILVLVSFLVGLKLGGGWGAFFAIPVGSILWSVFKELVEHLRERHRFFQ